MLRQLCDELANEKAVQRPHLFFFVKRALTNHLNEKHDIFFYHLYSVLQILNIHPTKEHNFQQ